MPAALALIAEPRRREILRLVWTRDRTAGEIAAQLPVTFGAVSQHLRLLREAGFVTVRKQGRLRIYRARPEALGPLAAALEAMWADGLERLKALAEDVERGGGGVLSEFAPTSSATPPSATPTSGTQPASPARPAPRSRPVPRYVSPRAPRRSPR